MIAVCDTDVCLKPLRMRAFCETRSVPLLTTGHLVLSASTMRILLSFLANGESVREELSGESINIRSKCFQFDEQRI